MYYLCSRKIKTVARVAKLVDAPDLGSGVLRRVGSSPITRTIGQKRNSQKKRVPLFLRIDNASSKRSREAPRQWCRVGCKKRVLSIFTSLPFLFKNRQRRQQLVAGCVAKSRHAGCDKTALSIFGKHTQEEIGISQAALNNYFSKLGESDEPIYKNKKCTIRKGTLYVKPTTRGRKKQKN